MDETQVTPQTTQHGPSFVLPPHSNKMAWSIICTLFCCLVGGIIAIINSSKSNSLYSSAMISSDDSVRSNLYYQSEASNKTAQTWITISLIIGGIDVIIFVVLMALGVFAEIADI